MNARNKQFLYKLIPPRSTFAQDMTEVERKVMQEHATYWKGVTDKGIAIVFGLVLDPKGLGELASLKLRMKQMHVLLAQMTPAVKAGLMFEVYPMPNAVVRK
jgi:hypothetical protein